MSAGNSHTCALAEGGQAYCWGGNGLAQVGPSATDTCFRADGRADSCSATPVRAAQGLMFQAIAASAAHTCGLATDGAVYCWGYGGSGLLGVEPDAVAGECPGTSLGTCSLSPIRVSGDLAFVSLTGGGSSCGLTEDERAYCWGTNLLGQLGDCSTREYSSLPQPVCGDHRFTLLEAGGGHACGLTADGAAFCWGRNDSGQLGAGTHGSVVYGPVKVQQTRPIRELRWW